MLSITNMVHQGVEDLKLGVVILFMKVYIHDIQIANNELDQKSP
jgi:hypothetical protein